MTIKRILLCLLSAALLVCTAACSLMKEEEKEPAVPMTAAQIIAFYNDAVGRAVDSRMSFVKRYHSADDKFSLSPALSAFKSRFREDTGVGQGMDDAVVTPESAGTEPYTRCLQRPTLTAQDVQKAACTLTKDGQYRVTLLLQDGGSHIAPGVNEYASALDKSGIAAGQTPDALYDHKTAQNIYEDICDLSPDVRIDEEHTDVTINALFLPDGTPVQLDIQFNAVYDVKGEFEIGLSAKSRTSVRYRQFGAETPVFPEEEEDE